MISLSISEQVHIFGEQTSQEALHNCITLAKMADTYGYKRFWVAEHHNNPSIACASPEILAAVIAANTTRIRVGTGGVVLPHYSALKIAEVFRMLDALFPNRIDLGIGRGRGENSEVCKALNSTSTSSDIGKYAHQIRDLVGLLTNSLPASHPCRDMRVMPDGVGVPEIWVLGTTSTSVEIAASQGLAFCFAQFMDKSRMVQTLETYHRCFRPSQFLDRPRVSLAVQVFCMEDEKEAYELAWKLSFSLMYQQKQALPEPEKLRRFPSREKVSKYVYTDQDLALMRNRPLPFILGTPMQVKEKLLELATISGVEELVLNTFYPDFEVRLRSYQLLAEAFSLTTLASKGATRK